MASKPIIVLDPGHGGRDPGGTSGNLHEADMVLAFAKVVAIAFEAVGFQVVMTRTSDSFVEIDDRTKLERSLTAVCFISLHMDWNAKSIARGVSSWLHSGAPASYVKWAEDVIAELRKCGYDDNRAQAVNKGHRNGPQYNYGVNADTRSPSMLLEMGFISNPNNAQDIVIKANPYARAIVIATCKFLKLPDTLPTAPLPPVIDDSCAVAALRKELAERDTRIVQLEDENGDLSKQLREQHHNSQVVKQRINKAVETLTESDD